MMAQAVGTYYLIKGVDELAGVQEARVNVLGYNVYSLKGRTMGLTARFVTDDRPAMEFLLVMETEPAWNDGDLDFEDLTPLLNVVLYPLAVADDVVARGTYDLETGETELTATDGGLTTTHINQNPVLSGVIAAAKLFF